jgi:hypothetical protein
MTTETLNSPMTVTTVKAACNRPPQRATMMAVQTSLKISTQPIALALAYGSERNTDTSGVQVEH